jgi:hypothetical protein
MPPSIASSTMAIGWKQAVVRPLTLEEDAGHTRCGRVHWRGVARLKFLWRRRLNARLRWRGTTAEMGQSRSSALCAIDMVKASYRPRDAGQRFTDAPPSPRSATADRVLPRAGRRRAVPGRPIRRRFADRGYALTEELAANQTARDNLLLGAAAVAVGAAMLVSFRRRRSDAKSVLPMLSRSLRVTRQSLGPVL